MTHYFNPPFTSNQSHLHQKKKRKHAVADSDNALSDFDNNERAQGNSAQYYKTPSQTLREQHLNVVNAIMHRSLIKGDFERAGRAWAMLLRAEVNGKPYDVRPQRRWGIGAEILLRGHAGPDNHQVQEGKDLQGVTLKGIAEAKAYYDWLILQYPARKYDSKTVDSTTFYPVMYGLWVYEVQLHSEQAMKNVMERSSCSVNNDSLDDFNAEINYEEKRLEKNSDLPQSMPHEEIQGHVEIAETALNMSEQVTAIRTTELKGAKEIAERIDETISSPPYDKNEDLLQLRDMIALWIEGLVDRLSKETDISDDASNHAESEEEEEEGTGK